MKGFADIRFFHPKAGQRFKKNLKKMDELLAQGFQSWVLDRAGRRLLAKLEGKGRGRSAIYDVATNRAARRVSARIIAHRLRAMLKANPSLRIRHLTMIGDEFVTNHRDTKFELGLLKHVLQQLLASSKLDGWIGCAEIQAEANWEAGVGLKLLGHEHVIIWTADPDFDFKALEAKLCASKRLCCALGAATVKISGEKEGFDGLSLGDKLELVSRWAFYPLKMPTYGKNLVPVAGKPDSKRIYEKDIRPDVAVRLFEILSRVSCYELFSSSGEGKPILAAIKRAIPGAGKRIERAAFDRKVEDFWAFTRRRNGKTQFKPVKVNRAQNGKRPPAAIRGPYKKVAPATAEPSKAPRRVEPPRIGHIPAADPTTPLAGPKRRPTKLNMPPSRRLRSWPGQRAAPPRRFDEDDVDTVGQFVPEP